MISVICPAWMRPRPDCHARVFHFQ
jgi:hypothetical protein